MSYSPVRGFYDQVVARYHQTGRYNDETGGKSPGGDQRYAVAIMTAEKSWRHLEGHANGKHGCEVQHRVAGHVLLVH